MNAASDTHSKTIGYILWIFGFTGAQHFFMGMSVTGIIYMCTAGLLGIGHLFDFSTLNDQITMMNVSAKRAPCA